MNDLRPTAALLTLLFLQFVTPARGQVTQFVPPVGWRVGPGDGVGPLELHETPTATVIYQLGKKNKEGFYAHLGVRLERLDDDGSIDLIELTKPFAGSTEQGIGIDSSAKAVKEAFGTPAAQLKGKSSTESIWVYPAKGIGFRIQADVVTHIGLFRWQEIAYPDTAKAKLTENIVLIPGTGMEGMFFGIHERGRITERFGPPTSIESKGRKHPGFLGSAYIYPDRGLIFVANRQSEEISHIMAMAPFAGKTKEGIKIGSSLAAVREAYSGVEIDYIRIRYPERGVDFYFNGAQVMLMLIYSNVKDSR